MKFKLIIELKKCEKPHFDLLDWLFSVLVCVSPEVGTLLATTGSSCISLDEPFGEKSVDGDIRLPVCNFEV